MKSSPKLRPNGWDALAAAAVLALAVACAALFWTGGEEIGPLTAVVSANGEPVDRVVLADLSGPEERTYTSNGYTLRVAFGPESAQVTVSDCPTQDCVHMGEITRGGQSIVCLPARIVVELVGAADGYDLAKDFAARGEGFTSHARALGRALAVVHHTLADRLPTATISGTELADGCRRRFAEVAAAQRAMAAGMSK